jgi:hypothetical protein
MDFVMTGAGEAEAVFGALSGLGYAVERTGLSPWRRKSFWVGSALALIAAVAGVMEFMDLRQVSHRLASKQGVQGTVFTEEGVYYIIDGKEVKAGNVPIWDRLPIFQWFVMLVLLVYVAFLWGRARAG